MRIVVASRNPVKIEATREAFACYFDDIEVRGIAVESEVPEQPVGEQTLRGARNRAAAAWRMVDHGGEAGDVDYCVGIEGGIVRVEDRWFALGWMCIRDAEGTEAFGASPWFELPKSVTGELLEGVELGVVMDRVAGESDTKSRGGAIGHFTRGVVDRRELYAAGLRVALVPVLNREIFAGPERR